MTAPTNSVKRAYTLTEEIDWETTYREYLPRVYNFFRYRVGDQNLAEDMTAATFEKAWRGRSRFRRDLGAFSTWLFTIARNVGIDYFRRQEPNIPLDAVREQADLASLEEIVQHKDDSTRLSTLLSQLPTREHELVAFKYGAGLTNREIARLTHLSESNVGIILYRVVARLRTEMGDTHER
jgi:RNA polymerase sigma-70 factor (ECF subfamily)